MILLNCAYGRGTGKTPMFETFQGMMTNDRSKYVGNFLAYLFMIFVVVTQFNSNVNPVSNRFFSHSKHLEIFWTLIPAFILFGIATPTFSLLYALEDFADGDEYYDGKENFGLQKLLPLTGGCY